VAGLKITPHSAYFSPLSAAGDQVCRFSVRLSLDSELRLKIFDLAGRLVRDLDPSVYNLRGEGEWDGRDRHGNWCPAGVYVLYAETRRQGVTVERQKCAVVLAR
jgi:hypothetical protein